MIAITYTAIKVKKEECVDEINKGAASIKTNRRIFISHFVFLQMTMLCRLITIAILLFYAMGLGDSDNLPVLTIRIIYNTSLINLCIVYAISLYQWIFIVHRINLYSGLLTVNIFRRRDLLTKILYSLVIAGTLGFNLVLLIIEAWDPKVGISTAATSAILFELSALLLCFIVTGSILIRRLKLFF